MEPWAGLSAFVGLRAGRWAGGYSAAVVPTPASEPPDISAAVNGVEVPVRIPFSERLTERRQVRAEAVRMYREACAALGLQPSH